MLVPMHLEGHCPIKCIFFFFGSGTFDRPLFLETLCSTTAYNDIAVNLHASPSQHPFEYSDTYRIVKQSRVVAHMSIKKNTLGS